MMVEIMFHTILSPSPVVPPPNKVGVDGCKWGEVEK